MTDPIVEAVREKLANRAAFGIHKYGHTVQSNPLSKLQWLRHAQEEAMDLAVYLEKLMEIERAAK